MCMIKIISKGLERIRKHRLVPGKNNLYNFALLERIIADTIVCFIHLRFPMEMKF